jgi:preprotein translocase subunit YajC
VFYFVLLRPQQKRAREQADMLKSIKSGDKIVTTGGVLGTVITVKDKSVSIRSADSKMEITKSAIAEVVERSGDSSSSSDS